MAIFKKKKKEPEQVEPVVEEEEVVEVPQTEMIGTPNTSAPIQETQPLQPLPPPTEPVEEKTIAKILSGELIDIDGRPYHRYILLSNKSIGEIGDEFPVE